MLSEKIKHLLFFSAAVIISTLASAQVDKIKDKADENQENRNQAGNNEPGSGGSRQGSGAGCVGWLANACISGCLNGISLGVADLQSEQLRKKKDIPTVVSFELRPHFGYNIPSAWLLMPEVRGNWGIISSDFRFYGLVETDPVQGADFYVTYDWQILQFNLINLKSVNLYLGSGFMKEDYTRTFYNEHSLGITTRFADGKYLADAGFRMAFDYTTGAIPRSEVNLKYCYSLLEMENLRTYAMAGGLYQNYYQSVDLWNVQAGFYFLFH